MQNLKILTVLQGITPKRIAMDLLAEPSEISRALTGACGPRLDSLRKRICETYEIDGSRHIMTVSDDIFDIIRRTAEVRNIGADNMLEEIVKTWFAQRMG